MMGVNSSSEDSSNLSVELALFRRHSADDTSSPIDAAWDAVLQDRCDCTTSKRIREVFDGTKSLSLRSFSLLHEAVLCLRDIPIRGFEDLVRTQDINELDSHERTALWWAASRGCVDAVKALLSLGADLHNADTQSERPLHIAIRNGHKECEEILREWCAGANSMETECAINALRPGRFE